MDQQKQADPSANATSTSKVVVPAAVTAGVCLFISFVAGILASRGLITKETLAYLGTTEFQAVVGTVLLAGAGIWSTIKNRPHGLIESTAALKQVDAVITKPKTADEINSEIVVGTVEEAAKVVPHRARKPAAQP